MSSDVASFINNTEEVFNLEQFEFYYTDVYEYALRKRYDETYPKLCEHHEYVVCTLKQVGALIKLAKQQGCPRRSDEVNFLFDLLYSLQTLRDRLSYLLVLGEEVKKEMDNNNPRDFDDQSLNPDIEQQDQVEDHASYAPINLGRSQQRLERKRKHYRKNRGLRLYLLGLSFLSFFTILLFFFRNYDFMKTIKARVAEMFAFSLYDFFLTRVIVIFLIGSFSVVIYIYRKFFFLFYFFKRSATVYFVRDIWDYIQR